MEFDPTKGSSNFVTNVALNALSEFMAALSYALTPLTLVRYDRVQGSSNREGRKRQNSDRSQIKGAEPKEAPIAHLQDSHPCSGVFPRNTRYANAEYASTIGVTTAAPASMNT
jgi:hypothetical protein